MADLSRRLRLDSLQQSVAAGFAGWILAALAWALLLSLSLSAFVAARQRSRGLLAPVGLHRPCCRNSSAEFDERCRGLETSLGSLNSRLGTLLEYLLGLGNTHLTSHSSGLNCGLRE